jgi:osmotically-inducible protein OsmY
MDPSIIRLGALLGALIFWTTSISANTPTSAKNSLEPIVVTAQKHRAWVPDEVLKQQVESALHDAVYFPDMHVEVTVRNGVAYLEGVVFENSDVTDAKRIARRIPGVRSVICNLEIDNGDID